MKIVTQSDKDNYARLLSAFYMGKLKKREMGSFYHRSSPKRIQKWSDAQAKKHIEEHGYPEEHDLMKGFVEDGFEESYTLYYTPDIGITTGIDLNPFAKSAWKHDLEWEIPEEAHYSDVTWAEFHNGIRDKADDFMVCKVDSETCDYVEATHGFAQTFVHKPTFDAIMESFRKDFGEAMWEEHLSDIKMERTIWELENGLVEMTGEEMVPFVLHKILIEDGIKSSKLLD